VNAWWELWLASSTRKLEWGRMRAKIVNIERERERERERF